MVLVVTDDTNSARDVISIFMITVYVNNKPQSVNNKVMLHSGKLTSFIGYERMLGKIIYHD